MHFVNVEILAGSISFQVLISLCEAAVRIAQDAENRSILIDYGLIQAIKRLCQTVRSLYKMSIISQ